MKNQSTLFACVIRQYGTGLYRACVRLGQDHLVYLGTHPNEAGAGIRLFIFTSAGVPPSAIRRMMSAT